MAKRWLFLFLVTAAACDGAVEPRGTDAAADDAGPRPIDARPPDAPTPSSCDDWTSEDLGPVELAGSWTCDPSTGVHTVEASGRDIWGTEDELRFVYQTLRGDGSITARVARFDAMDPWAKAGLMMRESLDADAAHAHVLVSHDAANPIKLDRRESAGETTTGTAGPITAAPYWLRLVRSGDTFRGYASADGETWTAIGAYTVVMPEEILVGLSLTANDPPSLVEAAFESVTLERGVAPECEEDADCGAGEVCDANVCAPAPEGCGAGPACMAGERCEAGACVPDGAFTGHEALLNDIVGYGRGVTGGAGGRLIEVTNTNASGAGSLRAALAETGPTWIYFSPGLTGTIDLSGLAYVYDDTTIDGRGANIGIGGHTLNLFTGRGTEPSNNIVVHNVRFTGGAPDRRTLLRVRFGRGFWLDHISFEAQAGDGKPLGFGDAVTDITVSWCDFSRSRASLIWIIGSDNESPGDAAMRITSHHNLFEGTSERHPRARYATIHWLNNAVIDWGGYGSSITQDGYFFAENSVYEAGRRTDNAIVTRIGSFPASGDPLEGNLRTEGNWWANGTVPPTERNPSSVTDPPYPYTAEPADAALIARLRAESGWQDVPSPFE